MLGNRAVDGFLHRLAQKTLAELLFQQRQWHLALAKPLHLDIGLGFGQFFVDLGVQFIGADGDRVSALQTLVQGFGDLHDIPHKFWARRRGAQKFGAFYWPSPASARADCRQSRTRVLSQ